MFLIASIKGGFGDAGVIVQDDNASCHRAKSFQTFLQERHINLMTLQENSLDLNQIFLIIHDKAPSCKADLSTAIQECLNLID